MEDEVTRQIRRANRWRYATLGAGAVCVGLDLWEAAHGGLRFWGAAVLACVGFMVGNAFEGLQPEKEE